MDRERKKKPRPLPTGILRGKRREDIKLIMFLKRKYKKGTRGQTCPIKAVSQLEGGRTKKLFENQDSVLRTNSRANLRKGNVKSATGA